MISDFDILTNQKSDTTDISSSPDSLILVIMRQI